MVAKKMKYANRLINVGLFAGCLAYSAGCATSGINSINKKGLECTVENENIVCIDFCREAGIYYFIGGIIDGKHVTFNVKGWEISNLIGKIKPNSKILVDITMNELQKYDLIKEAVPLKASRIKLR